MSSSLQPVFHSSSLMFLLAVSFFGLFLVSAFTLNPPISNENFIWRKPVIGSMFASLCVLGILAVFFPNQCSKIFNLEKREKSRNKVYGLEQIVLASQSDFSSLRGHHPACGHFSFHVFHVGSRVFCATCSGLFLGASIVSVGVALYFFGSLQIGQNASSIAWVGMLGVVLGLLQPLFFSLKRSFLRVFSGAFLATGSFLVLIGFDELAHNAFLDFFLFLLTLLWLMTRISLSQWEHWKICSSCTLPVCDLIGQTKKGALG